MPANCVEGGGLSINADLETVLQLLAQAAEDAEKIGAVSAEVILTDPFGAGVLLRFVGETSEVKPEEPTEWH